MEAQLQNSTTLADLRMNLRNSLVPKYGEREATAMARTILMTLKGWNLTQLIANEEREAGDFIKNRAQEIYNLLLKDVPIQYALGETTFYGLKLKVGPGVLIPRPETEELVDLIVRENQRSDLEVLDLCTGSGAIAIALARNLPFARVEAVDISSEAIAIARENAELLKVKIDLRNEDIFTLVVPDAYFDIIVSNPPYVTESEKNFIEPNVLNFEPHEALFVSDENPLVFFRHITEIAAKALVAGGSLYFEINPLFSSQIKNLLTSSGFQNVRIIKDVHGNDRFAAANAPA